MHKADRIRNVALVGHRGSGKTSLHEALLFQAGATNRLGSVTDGSTVSDSDPDEQARQMSISAHLSSFEWDERKINLHRHPRRAELRRRRARRAARVRVGGLRRQRRDGRRGRTARLWERADELDLARMIFVNMLDRERADFFRTLEQLKAAFGRARRRDRDPDRLRARRPRRDRPRRHEGLRVRRRAARDNCTRDPDPRRHAGARRGVPREADGRGRRGLRRADGALPGGRGDLPRGDRHRAEGRHEPRRHLPGHLRRRDAQPRHQPAARRDRRGPAVAGQARRPRAARDHARARSEAKPLYAYVFKTRADPFAGRINFFRVYQGVDAPGRPRAEHARPRQGAHRPAARVPGQGERAAPTGSARATSAPSPSSRRRAPATGSPTATSRSRCRRSSCRSR